ncbi:MAG: MobC family plasmid mobilization relaxosome protein [Deltaproteobacteria bacterium]|jgi:hypothetical protein|nr:MobC family plasmid mobilization relaxosome protein [Deltaproteobacteria bacterium]
MARDAWLKIRVTPEERAAFAARAVEARMSLSDFFRHRLTTGRVRQTAEERETVRHLARIGANLNQLARWANTHKNHAEAIEVILCLDQLRDTLKTIGGTGPCT